jgi:hypothetical protein
MRAQSGAGQGVKRPPAASVSTSHAMPGWAIRRRRRASLTAPAAPASMAEKVAATSALIAQPDAFVECRDDCLRTTANHFQEHLRGVGKEAAVAAGQPVGPEDGQPGGVVQGFVLRQALQDVGQAGVTAVRGEGAVVRDAEAFEHHLQQEGERLRRTGFGQSGDEAVEGIRFLLTGCEPGCQPAGVPGFVRADQPEQAPLVVVFGGERHAGAVIDAAALDVPGFGEHAGGAVWNLTGATKTTPYCTVTAPSGWGILK